MASKETRAFRIRAFLFVVSSASVVCAVLFLSRPTVIEELELRLWDWRSKLIAQAPVESPVRIITIDQSSLDYLARHENIHWQWPRGVYEAALQYLKLAGARAVAFDILFTEPSVYGVDDDVAFAQACESTVPVVTALSMQSATTLEAPKDVELFLSRQRELQKLTRLISVAKRSNAQYPGVTLPNRQLLEKSQAFGDVTGTVDSDGLYRHVVPFSSLMEAVDVRVPKLPFALYALGYPGVKLNLSEWTDVEGKLALRLLGPRGTIPTESFANIFLSYQNILAGVEPLVPLSRFKDSLVFVGMTAPGLLDLRPTALSEQFPGVELNATILQNAIDRSFIRKPPLMAIVLGTTLLILLTTAGTLFLSGALQWLSSAVMVLGLVGGTLGAAHLGWWIPLGVPLLGALGATFAGYALLFVSEGRQKRFIKDAFRYYVSASIIDRIVDDPGQLVLGGEKRELTMFFSDIAGFTTISESLEAGKLVPMLNTYLSSVTEIIMQHGGTVDKYVGDAVVAFWNAPVSLSDHAERGVKAALEIQAELDRLQKVFEEKYEVTVKTRIGLNTGVVSVGNFGSSSRFSYTIIGDAANLASRLEGANKSFGTPILISDRTFQLLKGTIPCRRIGTIRVVGKTLGVVVYEPMGERHPMRMQSELYTHFERARECFERGSLVEAEELFLGIPNDSVSREYLKRIARERQMPSAEWSPQWKLSEK